MKQWLSCLLSNSICMTIPAFILLFLSPIVTKRYRAKVRYYAWLIILVGFLFLWSPQIKNSYPIIMLPDIYLSVEEFTKYTEISQKLPETTDHLQTNHNLLISDKNSEKNSKRLEKKSPKSEKNIVEIYSIFFYVWFCGFSLIIFYEIKKHQRLIRLINHWSEPYMEIIVNKLGKEKKISVKTCPIAISPMLIGLFHSMIILPKKDYQEKELSFILKHELVHYQRNDLWYKLLMLLVKAVHWFNPFLPFIFEKINQECEISCDAEVLSQANLEDRISYIETIINIIHYKSELKSSFSTLFLYKEENIMKKRIYAIMTIKKKKMGMIVLALVLLGTIFAGTVSIISVKEEINAEENTHLKEEENTDLEEKEKAKNIAIDTIKELLDSKKDLTSSDFVVSYDFNDNLLELSNDLTQAIENEDKKWQSRISGVERTKYLVSIVKEDSNGIGHDIGINVIITEVIRDYSSSEFFPDTQEVITVIDSERVKKNISPSEFHKELKQILNQKLEKLLEMDYIDIEDYRNKWEELEEEAGKEIEEWSKNHKEDLDYFVTNITFDNIWFS